MFIEADGGAQVDFTKRLHSSSNRLMEQVGSIQGYLLKRGRRVPAWKRRFFCVCNGEVHYYYSMEMSNPFQPLGVIPLATKDARGPGSPRAAATAPSLFSLPATSATHGVSHTVQHGSNAASGAPSPMITPTDGPCSPSTAVTSQFNLNPASSSSVPATNASSTSALNSAFASVAAHAASYPAAHTTAAHAASHAASHTCSHAANHSASDAATAAATHAATAAAAAAAACANSVGSSPTLLTIDLVSASSYHYGFTLATPHRRWVLAAGSEHERAEWVRMLCKAGAKLSAPDGLPMMPLNWPSVGGDAPDDLPPGGLAAMEQAEILSMQQSEADMTSDLHAAVDLPEAPSGTLWKQGSKVHITQFVEAAGEPREWVSRHFRLLSTSHSIVYLQREDDPVAEALGLLRLCDFDRVEDAPSPHQGLFAFKLIPTTGPPEGAFVLASTTAEKKAAWMECLANALPVAAAAAEQQRRQQLQQLQQLRQHQEPLKASGAQTVPSPSAWRAGMGGLEQGQKAGAGAARPPPPSRSNAASKAAHSHHAAASIARSGQAAIGGATGVNSPLAATSQSANDITAMDCDDDTQDAAAKSADIGSRMHDGSDDDVDANRSGGGDGARI